MSEPGPAQPGSIEPGQIQPGPDVSARLAWPDDAAAIAQVQLAAWQREFADVDELAALDPSEVAARWAAAIDSPKDARLRVLVGVERAALRGVVLVHPCFDPDADQVADGEIGELVIDPAHRGAGHGSRLVHAAVDTLRADGFTRAVWWLDSVDDARRAFATSAGWAPDGAHRELAAESGATVKQVRLHVALE